jgi:hypothetical protein
MTLTQSLSVHSNLQILKDNKTIAGVPLNELHFMQIHLNKLIEGKPPHGNIETYTAFQMIYTTITSALCTSQC